jgi:hypothetical protein
MKKIKILKSSKWSFRPCDPLMFFTEGETVELGDREADLLINANHGEEIKRGRPNKEEKDEKGEKKQSEDENKMVDLKKTENKKFKFKKKSEK